MCLTTVDKRRKSHKHGYKVFLFNRFKETELSTPHYHSDIPYVIGETYVANDGPPHFITAGDYSEYKSGYHYYLKLKDAKSSILNYENKVIVRILVDDICATGIDYHSEVGVAKKMTLQKIVFKIKKPKPIIEGSRLKNKAILRRKIPKFILKNILPCDEISEDTKNQLKVMIQKDMEFMMEWLCFCDSFERNFPMFRKLTKIHFEFLKDYSYHDFYMVVTNRVHMLGLRSFVMQYPQLRKAYFDYK